MQKITFTWYPHAQTNQGEVQTLSWEKWKNILLADHVVRGEPSDTDNKDKLNFEKNGPAIVLGHIPKGKKRSGANVRSIHALALDIETLEDEAVEEVFRKLLPWEFVVWTTHKHGSVVAGGKPRLRVLLPLEEPLSPGDHAAAWSGLDVLVGGNVNDPTTKDIGRLHFLPSTFDPSLAWSFHNAGKFISLEDLPDVELERKSTEELSDTRQRQFLLDLPKHIKKLPTQHKVKPAAKKLLEGEAFAAPGERHSTIVNLTFWLATVEKGLGREVLGALFNKSLEAMKKNADPPSLHEVVQAYEGAVRKIRQSDRDQLTEHQIKPAGDFQGPYSEDDLERIAKFHGWTLDELQERWVIQSGGGGWVLSESGEYRGPYQKEDFSVAISKYLARAPIRLFELSQKKYRLRPVGEIVRVHGCLADQVIADLSRQITTFDPSTSSMLEAVRPLRKVITPKYDEEIDTWLRALAGPLYPKLLDWMACCPDLTKMLCAIYFDGAPSSGKTLFAHGMSKLWTEGGPAEISAILEGFNDELTKCPLILADEEIPQSFRSQNVTALLRSMLSTTTRTLKRKFKSNADLQGAIRLVLTANNEFLLETKGVNSAQDLEAIAQRFLYISVTHEAADLLNSLPREKREYWAKAGIARHALWLAENHEVKEPGKRFWVEGDVSQMHRLLMTGSLWNSLCCEWLVRYLMSPQTHDTKNDGLIRREDGELLVNEQALIDGWELYLKTRYQCETAKVGAALRAISKTTKRKQLRWQGKHIRYRIIDVDHLLSWSDRYNIGDRETMLARIEGRLEHGENVIEFQGDKLPARADENNKEGEGFNEY